jgi:hypothetical protein
MSDAIDAAAALSEREESWYRALCDVGRAQVALELGRLDRCARLLASADGTARRSDSGALFVAAKLVELDLALMREDPGAVLAAIEALGKDDRFEGSATLLALPAALARIQLARESRIRTAEHAADLGAARAELEALIRNELVSPVERFKAGIALAELELLRDDATRAGEAVAAAEALVPILSGDQELALRELLLLPTIRWELERTDDESRDSARKDVETAYARLLAQWSRAADQPDGIGFLKLSWRTQVIGAAIESKLASGGARASERAFELVLQAQEQGSLARAAGLTADLARLRSRLLAKHRGAVVLLPARFRSHLFLVDGDGVRHWMLEATRDELRAMSRPVSDALHALKKPDSAALSAALLPADARAVLARWSEAYVVGFDLLADLPFGVLLGRDDEPIGRSLPYSVLPSLLFGELLLGRKLPEAADIDLALFVAQNPGVPDLTELPFGKRERARLVAPFARSAVVEHATRPQVLAKDRPRARIDHFLLHARRAPGGDSAVLVLERDVEGCELGVADVRGMEVAPLVIQSACAAGRSTPRNGDDLLATHGGAIHEAGARCVVLARFPVEYEATLALMEELGARIARGVPTARALQEARAALADTLEEEEEGAAAFEVLGLGHEAVFPRR